MKKFMMMALLIVAGIIFMPEVNAATVEELQKWGPTTHIDVTGDAETGYTLTLNDNAVQDIEILGNKNVTIDLNGHELTNYTANCSVIYITSGSTVKIVDKTGKGKIYLAQYSAGKPVPVIGNFGNLTIEGGIIESNQPGSTGVMNNENSVLNITGGTIIADKQGSTQPEAAFGVTNLGTATISGGTFLQNYQLSVVQNTGTMTIAGGVFNTGSTGVEHYSLIINENSKGVANLTIKNGDFNSNLILNNVGDDVATISGGNFQNPTAVSKYLAEGLTFDENGNVIVKPKEEATPITNNQNNPNTSDKNIIMILGLVLASGCGILYALRKKFN